MLPHRDDAACPGRGFYTYDAFVAAARAFPAFGATGGAAARKWEVAAFLAHTSHETSGGPFSWGYCYKEVKGATSDALRAERAVALLIEHDVPCTRAHADLLQLQLRAGRGGHRRRPAEQPGHAHGRRRRGVQDGTVAVDDPARADRAVVPRRRHGAVGPDARGPRGRTQAGLRADHEHPHRRAAVRRRQRPRRVLQALLRRPRRQLRARPGLRRPGAVRRRPQVLGAVDV